MKPRRILLISYHTCPLASEEGKETGGMNVYVLELGRQLAKLGYLVDAVTRSQAPDNLRVVPVTDGFRVIHLTAGPQSPVPKKSLLRHIPEFVDSVMAFAASEGISYDILDAHYYQSGLIALEINRRLQTPTPLVMTFHTLALMKNLVARSAAEQDGDERIDAEFALTRAADAIVTPSKSDRDYLTYLYGASARKIHEIPPGVNTTLFCPMDKEEARRKIGVSGHERIILFVGRIEPLKGIDTLLYAVRILAIRNPEIPVRLMIVGGDISQHVTKWSPPLRQLEHLRHTLRISARVDFLGQKPQHELPYYYNAAEAVVMPSHYESFGMSAAEAMACGTPVITTNVTGISYRIDERRGSLVTAVNNPLLLSGQLASLLSDREAYERIRRTVRESVQDLRWDVVARHVGAIYETAVHPEEIAVP